MHFKATNTITQEVVEYDADAPQAEHLQKPWRVERVEDAVPGSAPPPAYAGSWLLSRLAFRNRFTVTEKVTIELAAADNPAASMQSRQQSAAMRATLADQRDAEFIDLKRADTRAGVQALEAAGLLASGRAATILDTPPAPQEVFRG